MSTLAQPMWGVMSSRRLSWMERRGLLFGHRLFCQHIQAGGSDLILV